MNFKPYLLSSSIVFGLSLSCALSAEVVIVDNPPAGAINPNRVIIYTEYDSELDYVPERNLFVDITGQGNWVYHNETIVHSRYNISSVVIEGDGNLINFEYREGYNRRNLVSIGLLKGDNNNVNFHFGNIGNRQDEVSFDLIQGDSNSISVFLEGYSSNSNIGETITVTSDYLIGNHNDIDISQIRSSGYTKVNLIGDYNEVELNSYARDVNWVIDGLYGNNNLIDASTNITHADLNVSSTLGSLGYGMNYNTVKVTLNRSAEFDINVLYKNENVEINGNVTGFYPYYSYGGIGSGGTFNHEIEGNDNIVDALFVYAYGDLFVSQIGDANTFNLSNSDYLDTDDSDNFSIDVVQEGYENNVDLAIIEGNQNTIIIDQFGDDNKLSVSKIKGDDNEVFTSQIGSDNQIELATSNSSNSPYLRDAYINIQQEGVGNEVKGVFYNRTSGGNYDTLLVEQAGRANEALVIVNGSYNYLSYSVQGDYNDARIHQAGYANDFVMAGDSQAKAAFQESALYVGQYGAFNQASLIAKDNDNENNFVRIGQQNRDNLAYLSLSGDDNRMVVLQTDGSIADIAIEGDLNSIELVQSGYDNLIEGVTSDALSVQGVGNLLDVTQLGDFNTVAASLTSNFGDVTISQIGEANLAAIVQL